MLDQKADWGTSKLMNVVMNTEDPIEQEEKIREILENDDVYDVEVHPNDENQEGYELRIEKKKLKIYSQIECEYFANVMKKKIHKKDNIDDQGDLEEIYQRSLTTLGALMRLLLLN